MTYHDERWFNQTGQNLLRIVIGSYFAAVALGFAAGVNPAALFLPLMAPAFADLTGSSLLLAASIGFMLGAGLRMSALSLATFVFASTLAHNFVNFTPANVSGFWRDLAMICAVLSTYAHQSEKVEVAVVTPRPQPIRPRRISMAARADRPEQVDRQMPKKRGDVPAMPNKRAAKAAARALAIQDEALILTGPIPEAKLARQTG